MSARDGFDLLVQQLRESRPETASAYRPVFWLGAGCSVHDGVPLNSELLSRTVSDDPGAWGSPQFRFDQFCRGLDPGLRATYLSPHFTRAIRDDSPYHHLVHLLGAGYADLVFTFNIDKLLEHALEKAGLSEGRDYLRLVVPELQEQAVVAKLRAHTAPRLRIVKLHGDYEYGFNCMTSDEITAYDPKIEALVHEYSNRPAVVCGYSFLHLNVLTAFSRERQRLFYVNRSFPDAPVVLSLMSARSVTPLYIDGALGCFETFAPTLCDRLGLCAPAPAIPDPGQANP